MTCNSSTCCQLFYPCVGGAAARAAARAPLRGPACAQSFAGPSPPSSQLTLATWAFLFRTAARIREALRSSSTRRRLKGYVQCAASRSELATTSWCSAHWLDLASRGGMARGARATQARACLDAKRNSACQHARTLRGWSARTKSIEKWRCAPRVASCWEK